LNAIIGTKRGCGSAGFTRKGNEKERRGKEKPGTTFGAKD
jgi:hypothetical protein